MIFKSFLLFISLSLLNISYGCYARIKEGEEASKKFLHKFPLRNNLVIIFSEEGELGSGVLLSPSHVLTSAHGFRSNCRKRIACGGLNSVFVHQTLNFEQTLKRTQYTSEFENIDLGENFNEFVPMETSEEKIKKQDQTQEADLTVDLSSWSDFEHKILPTRTMNILGQNFILKGSDIALLKLKTPFNHIKNFPNLNVKSNKEIDNKVVHCIGHAVTAKNHKGEKGLEIGEQITQAIIIRNTPTFVVNQTIKFSPQSQGTYFCTRSALGGKDETFILNKNSKDPLEGLIIGGMSGGGVFVKDGQEFTLVAIVSESFAPDVLETINDLKEHYKNDQESLFYQSLLKQEQNLANKELPVYNLHQALTPALSKQIKKIIIKG